MDEDIITKAEQICLVNSISKMYEARNVKIPKNQNRKNYMQDAKPNITI